MKRMMLVLTGIALVVAMVALSAITSFADDALDTGSGDTSSGQYNDGGALDTGSGDTGSDQYNDGGALDTGSGDGAVDTGSDPADSICAPGWNQEWYQWSTPKWTWWYFWWYQWCWTSDDGWYRDYDSWEWWGPVG